MKRIGYVWEELTSIENCQDAVLSALKDKKKNKTIVHIREHYKEYGERLQKEL